MDKITEMPELKLEWTNGTPPKMYGKEWFIALTTYGDRVCLTALPEEYSCDYKTADDTYIKADRIVKWMQFPDSNYITPNESKIQALHTQLEGMAEALRELLSDNVPYQDRYTKGNQALIQYQKLKEATK